MKKKTSKSIVLEDSGSDSDSDNDKFLTSALGKNVPDKKKVIDKSSGVGSSEDNKSLDSATLISALGKNVPKPLVSMQDKDFGSFDEINVADKIKENSDFVCSGESRISEKHTAVKLGGIIRPLQEEKKN